LGQYDNTARYTYFYEFLGLYGAKLVFFSFDKEKDITTDAKINARIIFLSIDMFLIVK